MYIGMYNISTFTQANILPGEIDRRSHALVTSSFEEIETLWT